MQRANDTYAIIEPIPRCADENCPVVRVCRLGWSSGDIAIEKVMHGGLICRFSIHSLSEEGKLYEEDNEDDGKCVKLHCCESMSAWLE